MENQEFNIIRISSRGQLVLPRKVRDDLDIKKGSACIVMEDPKRKLIVLKKMEILDFEEDFKKISGWGSSFVKKHKITKKDLMEEVARVRHSI